MWPLSDPIVRERTQSAGYKKWLKYMLCKAETGLSTLPSGVPIPSTGHYLPTMLVFFREMESIIYI